MEMKEDKQHYRLVAETKDQAMQQSFKGQTMGSVIREAEAWMAEEKIKELDYVIVDSWSGDSYEPVGKLYVKEKSDELEERVA